MQLSTANCYEPSKGYSDEVKRDCLKMYVNGMGFRGIERVKGVYTQPIKCQVNRPLDDNYFG